MTIYRVYEAFRNSIGGVEGCGAGSEEVEADTAEQAAQIAADEWGWSSDEWDGGNVIVATDDMGDSYYLDRAAYLA